MNNLNPKSDTKLSLNLKCKTKDLKLKNLLVKEKGKAWI